MEHFLLYLYVCMSGIFDGVGISAKLSIQVNVILQMVVSAGKVADLQRVGMLSSLGEFSIC